MPVGVEQGQRSVHRLRGGGVAERVGGAQAPVPVVLGVGHGVDLDEQGGRLHVAVLVEDAQVELELAPVGGQRVDYSLEVDGERAVLASLGSRFGERHRRGEGY